MYDAGNIKPVLYDDLEGRGGREEEGELKREGILFAWCCFLLLYGKSHHSIVK